MPAARAARSRLIPASALPSASRRLLTRPSRSRRASARSSAAVRPVVIGTATMARLPARYSPAKSWAAPATGQDFLRPVSHPIPVDHSTRFREAAEWPGARHGNPRRIGRIVETRRPGFSATDSAQRRRRDPRLLGRVIGTPVRSLSPGDRQGPSYPGADGAVPPETPLQPSPEQLTLIDARRSDPAGSLRVLAFAGSGKTTALRLLARADPSPALYLAYNKAAQLELQAQARFPAHVACRTVHSLAYRATRMFEQRHRLAAREVAETLAIPALDGLRPS